jgi:iron complex outermembrane receptor protein
MKLHRPARRRATAPAVIRPRSIPVTLTVATPIALALACALAPGARAACIDCREAPAATPAAAAPALRAVEVRGSVAPGAGVARASHAPATDADPARLLLGLPGVSLNAAGGFSSLPQIDGLSDDRLAVQLDGAGLVASCPNHMNPVLSYALPSAVGRVTVYRGARPVSSGGDAIGGAVVVDSVPPQFAAPGRTVAGGEIGVGLRSNGRARAGDVSAHYGTDRFALRYDGGAASADDLHAGGDFKTFDASGRPGQNLGRDVIGSTAYRVRNQRLSAAWRRDDDTFGVTLAAQDAPLEGFPNQRMDLLGNTERRVELRWTRALEGATIDARVYAERVAHSMNFGADRQFLYGDAAGMPMNTDSHTTGANLKAGVELDAADTLHVGVDWQRYRLDDVWPASGSGMMAPDAFVNLADGRRDRLGAWGEWQRRLDRGWQLLAGARLEQVRSAAGAVHGYALPGAAWPGPGMQLRDAQTFNAATRSATDDNVDLSLIARGQPGRHVDVEFGVARNVRSPSLYQRYPWSTWPMAAVMNNLVGDGNGYIGNPALAPERATTVSATLELHDDDRAWRLSAMPFYTHVADYIDAVQWNAATDSAVAVPVTERFVTLKYQNQAARLYGIDVSARMPLARHGAVGDVDLEALLGWVRGVNTVTGNHLYGLMPPHARFTVAQRLRGWSNAVELVVVDAKTAVSAVRNEVPTAGYALLNLRASRSWSALRVDFGVDNVFDRAYALPTGGAYVGQGRTMAINGVPWGIALPGPGRSVYARGTLTF